MARRKAIVDLYLEGWSAKAIAGYLLHAALAQLGIDLSPRTCGRILTLHRTMGSFAGYGCVKHIHPRN